MCNGLQEEEIIAICDRVSFCVCRELRKIKGFGFVWICENFSFCPCASQKVWSPEGCLAVWGTQEGIEEDR